MCWQLKAAEFAGGKGLTMLTRGVRRGSARRFMLVVEAESEKHYHARHILELRLALAASPGNLLP